MSEQHQAAQAWPANWHWSAAHQRSYAARNAGDVRLREVDVGGVRETGVLLPVRSTPRWQAISFGLVGVVFVALAAVLGAVSVADGEWGGLVGVVVLGLPGLVLCLAAVVGLRSRRGPDLGVSLTRSRVVVDFGADQVVVRWEQVSGIAAFHIRYGVRSVMPKPVQNWVGLEAADPDSVLTPDDRSKGPAARLAAHLPGSVVAGVPDTRLAVSPLVVYHALRYYVDHPADRRELAGEAGSQRIKGLAAQ